ncbi:MAG: hypothetical protein RSD57_12375 [Comamonas sp.]
MEIAMNRAQRRAEAKAAKKKTVHTVIKAAQGACALFAQLAMCRPHDAGPIPGDGSNLSDYALQVRTRSINNVQAAMLRLTERSTDQIDDVMILSEALGVSSIRAIEIAGPDESTNPVLKALHDGQRALHSVVKRHGKWGEWEMLELEHDAVSLGIEWYVDIITNSTPQQMEGAMKTRLRMRELANQSL